MILTRINGVSYRVDIFPSVTVFTDTRDCMHRLTVTNSTKMKNVLNNPFFKEKTE